MCVYLSRRLRSLRTWGLWRRSEGDCEYELGASLRNQPAEQPWYDYTVVIKCGLHLQVCTRLWQGENGGEHGVFHYSVA